MKDARDVVMTITKILSAAVVLALLGVVGAAQSPPPLLVQSIPVGQKPLGVGILSLIVGPSANTNWIAVVNSGDNSVSTFNFSLGSINAAPTQRVIQGIPSPYGVGGSCLDSPLMVVTSPSSNSVSVIDATKGTLIGTIKVGSQPYSSQCGVVSNYGDSSLSLIDWASLRVTKTIPSVPGSRNREGIAISTGSRSIAWVSGSDANVVTLVDLNSGAVIATLPVRGPTSVHCCTGNSVIVTSSTDNSVLFFDTSTLTLTQTIPNVPNPQDFVNTGFGNFAIVGPGSSLAQIGAGSLTIIAMVPAPASLAAGSVVGHTTSGLSSQEYLLVTSPDLNSVFLVRPQPPLPQLPGDFGVGNGASFTAGLVGPGTLASLFATAGVSQNFSAASVPLPKTLGGVTLSVGGSLSFDATAGKWNYSSTGSVQATLLFVGPSQINFQIPPGIAPGSAVPAQLTKPDGTTLLTTLNITATAPGIFTVLQNGQGQAAVLNQDNSQNFGTNPAKLGSVIQIFATGGGDTTPSLAPGDAAPASGNPLILTNAQPTVTIGGVAATVQFSGMAPGYVGLWQINAQIPQSVAPGNAVPLVVSAGGVASNTVTIAVQ